MGAAALGSLALLLTNATSIWTSLSGFFGLGDPQLSIRDAQVLNIYLAGDVINPAPTQTHNEVVFVAQKKDGVRVRNCNVRSLKWPSPAVEGWYTGPDPEPQSFDLKRDITSTEVSFVLRVIYPDVGREVSFFLACNGVVSNALVVTLVGH